MSSGTVYPICYKMCEDKYIGYTGRPLCVRINENPVGKFEAKPNTTLGAHRIQAQDGKDFEKKKLLPSYRNTKLKHVESSKCFRKIPKIEK